MAVYNIKPSYLNSNSISIEDETPNGLCQTKKCFEVIGLWPDYFYITESVEPINIY